jgi:hypothetical protein
VSFSLAGVAIIAGLCICVYVNTWLVFNARRLVTGGFRKFARNDVLQVVVVIVANSALWWATAAHPLPAIGVWLPAIARFLVDLRHRGVDD